MRRLIMASTVIAAGMVAGASVQAMPALAIGPDDGGVIKVEGGCGPGGHRGPNGLCYPNYQRPIYRGCPPGFHINPYGRCRPNY